MIKSFKEKFRNALLTVELFLICIMFAFFWKDRE